MKRLLIALLLLAAPAWAGEPFNLARMNPAVLGAGVSAAGSGCSEANDEIGNKNTVSAAVYTKDTLFCNIHTADCSSKTKTAYLYSTNADPGSTATVCIYDCPDGDTCDGSAAPTANAVKRSCSGSLADEVTTWVSAAMDTAYSVTKDKAYWICFSNDGSTSAWNGQYTSGAARFTRACSNCGANAASMPSTLDGTWTGPTADRNMSVYVTIGD